MTRSAEAFEPAEDRHVRMYTCGPTVYNFAHIGNFRAYMFEDLLRRHLEFRGYRVTQVMNLTDVDDKTIKGAMEQGVSLSEFTRTFKDAFFEDLKILGIQPAAEYPAATEHIAGMVKLIQQLLDKGLAYRSEDGSVYFSIAKFPGYGKLAHLDLEGLKPGARVEQDEYEKEHVGDFAVWKAWTEADGDVAWDAPWGRGRPGWHIECSAMAMEYLGDSFDIHCGGVDNIFPHHEDEIAQSEGATGKTFARYWLHNAHLVVDGAKMSKSLGNFYTLRELLDRGHGGREIRYVLLTGAHYRQTLNFSFSGLEGARSALHRLDEFTLRLREAAAGTDAPVDAAPPWARRGLEAFGDGLDDDLNISRAMAALFDLVRDGHRAMDEGHLDASAAAGALAVLRAIDGVLAFLEPSVEATPAEVQALADQRQAARASKDWAEADRLRDQIAALGWTVKDTPEGPKLSRTTT
jgi:cysteinyl-tRNA synthetase